MVVFPVKTKKEDAAVSPLFGKAKYFAFYEDGELEIKENPYGHGSALIDWFKMKGVKNIVIKEMGMNPYKKIQQTDMNIFYSGDERITISEVLEKYKNGSLEKLVDDRMQEIIKKHQRSHNHEHNHEHGKHH